MTDKADTCNARHKGIYEKIEKVRETRLGKFTAQLMTGLAGTILIGLCSLIWIVHAEASAAIEQNHTQDVKQAEIRNDLQHIRAYQMEQRADTKEIKAALHKLNGG